MSQFPDRVTIRARESVTTDGSVSKTESVTVKTGVRCALHTIAPRSVRSMIGEDSFDSPVAMFGPRVEIKQQWEVVAKDRSGNSVSYRVARVRRWPNDVRVQIQIAELDKELV